MNISLLVAFKSVIRNFKNSIISILGLSLAFVVSMFILIYVNYQLSIDKSLSNYKDIYRLEKDNWALLAGGVIPWVEETFPEVTSHTRIGGTYWESIVDYDNNYYSVSDVLFIDGEPFDVFDYEFLYGNPETALDAPNAVILTDELSKRIFANENPIGKLLNYNGEFPLIVTSVVKKRRDLHLSFDMLINFGMLSPISYQGDDEFMSRLNGGQNFMGYMVIKSDNPELITEKINSKLIEIGAYDPENSPPEYLLRPFKDIYFFNTAVTEHGVVHGNFQTVIALIFVGLFVLIMASINYINITTAMGLTRAREVGLRKLVGSGRRNLLLQFIFESIFIGLIAMVIAIIGIIILYAPFQTILGLTLPLLSDLPVSIYLIGPATLFLTSFIGGLYPALFLSSLKPRNLFDTDLKSGRKGILVRRSLIFLQFVIAIFLTAQSLAIFRQYLYMKNKDLGMDKDQIILFELPSYLSDRSDAIRASLLEHNYIDELSFALQPLGNIRNTNTLTSPVNEEQVPFKMQLTDPEYFKVLGIEFRSGRAFTRDREADKSTSWIINETGALALGYNPPESITGLNWAPYGGTREVEIIGVVKDYHYNSVNKTIEPTILLWSDGYNKVQVRFSPGDIPGVLSHIESTWKQFEQNRPLNYSFLDETFDKNYLVQQRLGNLMGIFTAIAVIIGCFGVFGISAFMAKQMSRSVSLRRVMGAGTGKLVWKFSLEYLWIVLLAGIFATPLAYLYINSWLSRFPYKSGIAIWVFAAAILLNLLVALVTVSYHAFVTARQNPADILRYE